MADYPQLIRFDPLVIRVTDTSLMISNVIFNAECVRGLAFTGFRIYASCVGNPIYEEEVEVGQNASADNAMRTIKAKVNDWLFNLQRSVEDPSNSARITSIKDSIDRAGWQQHYDLVGYSTDTTTFDSITINHWKDKYEVDGAGIIEDAIKEETQRINAMNNTLNTVNTNTAEVRHQIADQVTDAGLFDDGKTLRYLSLSSWGATWRYVGWQGSAYPSALYEIYDKI